MSCNNLCQITNFKFVEFSFPEFNLDLARGYITQATTSNFKFSPIFNGFLALII